MKAIDDITDIQLILDKLIALLMSVDETNWLKVMQLFRERTELPGDEDKLSLLSDIMGIYGGMGSFNDLILYKNGNLMIEETTCLDELRTNLFKAVMDKRNT